jgi:hypothetical protein
MAYTIVYVNFFLYLCSRFYARVRITRPYIYILGIKNTTKIQWKNKKSMMDRVFKCSKD